MNEKSIRNKNYKNFAFVLYIFNETISDELFFRKDEYLNHVIIKFNKFKFIIDQIS